MKASVDSSDMALLPSQSCPHILSNTKALKDIPDPNPKTYESHKEGER